MWLSDSYTDTGRVRQINEDSVLDLNGQRLWGVADGMGGHASGDYASQLVTRTLSSFVASVHPGISKQRVVAALHDCNDHLIRKADQEQAGIIGCTVALLTARSRSILCSWSGDSRIYRLRGTDLMQLTRDHSQQSAVEDRDHLAHPASMLQPSQILTCAIGGAEQLSVEHCWYTLQDHDAFLLCTDGLNKEVSDQEIQRVMLDSSEGCEVLESLAALYRERGARDNVGMVWAARSA
jgi:serine/threonine protein phosphatase PrpC